MSAGLTARLGVSRGTAALSAVLDEILGCINGGNGTFSHEVCVAVCVFVFVCVCVCVCVPGVLAVDGCKRLCGDVPRSCVAARAPAQELVAAGRCARAERETGWTPDVAFRFGRVLRAMQSRPDRDGAVPCQSK